MWWTPTFWRRAICSAAVLTVAEWLLSSPLRTEIGTDVARLAQLKQLHMECSQGMPMGLLLMVPVTCKEGSVVDVATSDCSGRKFRSPAGPLLAGTADLLHCYFI